MSTLRSRPQSHNESATPVSPRLQRKCACEETGETCSRCAKERLLQRKPEGGPTATSPLVDRVLTSAGTPLAPDVRSFMENRMGHDFSNVRIHADELAAASSLAVRARAYTVGSHVAFGSAHYNPQTFAGRELLAHELTHVVQQSNVVGPTDDAAAEREADAVGARVAFGAPVRIHGSASTGLHRQEASEEELKKQREKAAAGCESGKCHPAPAKPTDWREGSLSPADAAKWVNTPAPAPSRSHPSPDKRNAFEKAKADMASPEQRARMARAAPDIKAASAQEKSRQEENQKRSFEIAKSTGSMYLDPALDRPEAEQKLREEHKHLKLVSPDIAAALESDPGYWKAMGIFKEQSQPDSASIPAATAGIPAPATVAIGSTSVLVDNPAYWGTPRGRARSSLSRDITVTKNALHALYGERSAIVDSSVVIRKTAETMVGIDPPPLAQLDRCRSLLEQAEQALQEDDVERAASLYRSASGLHREASWYWSRYKDLLFLGGDRTIEHLQTVKEASKHSLMVLGMGGGAAIWIAIAGGIAIDVVEAGTQEALGDKVDWSRVAAESAVQILLARFGGRFTKSLTGRLAKVERFAKFESSEVAGAIVGVLNGMEARLVTNAVGSGLRGDTWEQTFNNMLKGLADWTLFLDMVLGAAHSSLARRNKKGPEPGDRAATPHTKDTTAREGGAASKQATELVENVNPDTTELYQQKPELKKALERSPRAARALKKCNTPCFPEFATATQIDRLEDIIASAERFTGPVKFEELTKFLRSKKNWAELETTIEAFEAQLASKRGSLNEFWEANKAIRGDGPTPQGRESTAVLRSRPGEAHGGTDLPDVAGRWFPERPGGTGETDFRVARIPGQIARSMRGMHFENFDDFRQTFWQMVARDPGLRNEFAYYPENLERMQSGLAPWPPSRRVGATRVETTGRGSNAVYQLDHGQPIKSEGGVYDLDNIEIKTPLFHQESGQ